MADINCETSRERPLVEIYIKEEMEEIPVEDIESEETETRVVVEELIPKMKTRSEPGDNQAGRVTGLSRKRTRLDFEQEEKQVEKEIEELIPKKRTVLNIKKQKWILC